MYKLKKVGELELSKAKHCLNYRYNTHEIAFYRTFKKNMWIET